jgi:hypothetical protein
LAICRVREQAALWSERKASRTVSADVRSDHGWKTTLRIAAAMLSLTVAFPAVEGAHRIDRKIDHLIANPTRY